LGFDSLLVFDGLTRPTHLPRDVPEKAEAFLREALCAASHELPPFVAMMSWLAAPDQRKASFFQTHHGAGVGGWRVVKSRHFVIAHAFD
jgi:hypothetical protein